MNTKNYALLLVFALISIITSCDKDENTKSKEKGGGSNNTIDLVGTWHYNQPVQGDAYDLCDMEVSFDGNVGVLRKVGANHCCYEKHDTLWTNYDAKEKTIYSLRRNRDAIPQNNVNCWYDPESPWDYFKVYYVSKDKILVGPREFERVSE